MKKIVVLLILFGLVTFFYFQENAKFQKSIDQFSAPMISKKINENSSVTVLVSTNGRALSQSFDIVTLPWLQKKTLTLSGGNWPSSWAYVVEWSDIQWALFNKDWKAYIVAYYDDPSLNWPSSLPHLLFEVTKNGDISEIASLIVPSQKKWWFIIDNQSKTISWLDGKNLNVYDIATQKISLVPNFSQESFDTLYKKDNITYTNCQDNCPFIYNGLLIKNPVDRMVIKAVSKDMFLAQYMDQYELIKLSDMEIIDTTQKDQTELTWSVWTSWVNVQ
jgi:hypothetical protein